MPSSKLFSILHDLLTSTPDQSGIFLVEIEQNNDCPSWSGMTEHPLGLQESLDPMWDLNPFLFVCEIHNYNTHSSQEVRLVQPSASRNLSTTTTSAAHRRSPSKVLCPLTALHSCSTMWSLWSFVYFGRGKTCLQQELQKQHFVQASLSFFLPPEKNFKDTKVSTGEGWTEQPPWLPSSITKW